MKNYQCCIILFFLYAAKIFAQPFDAIINLGSDCQITHQLKIHGLRTHALPFDWLITPYDSLQAILQNNFYGFLDADNFEFCKDKKLILDKKYGTFWMHDFKLQDDFLKDYSEIAVKYQRRIERFLYLVTNSQYPLFIRKRITQQQALALFEIVSVLRQAKPFWLVVVDGTEEMKYDWQIPGISNYYLRQLEPYSWKGDEQAWKEIFESLKII